MEFGLLKSNRRYVADDIEIRPLWDIDRVISEFQYEANISDGWIYPPLVEARKLKREAHTKKFDVFAEYYTLPATHSIIFHPYDYEKSKFLILGIGFFFGVYLSPAEYYNIGKVAYAEGKLTGVIPIGKDIELALNYLAKFYDDSSDEKRAGMFAVIHWFLIGQSHYYPWDRFEAQYKILDGLFKLSGIARCPHTQRPAALAQKYSLLLPNWAELENGSSVLSKLRNELAHEALYAGKPIGYAHPEQNYDVDFSSFNTKLIAATLGIESSYLQASSQDRQYSAWNIV
ncbi:hypothetical protein [Vibrio sp. 10N.237.312.B06]|uniref:hypothetical protein n=1 Tax=Vibrio sp. 10N.237.312.B06 TaxID=3229974 RepID=UPI0035537FCE